MNDHSKSNVGVQNIYQSTQSCNINLLLQFNYVYLLLKFKWNNLKVID